MWTTSPPSEKPSENVDDPKTCPLPTVAGPGRRTRCEGGAYITEWSNGKAGDPGVYTFGGPARDVAIAARLRAAKISA